MLTFSGADVNICQGLPQCINLQAPPDTRAIIGPVRYGPFIYLCDEKPYPRDLTKVLDLYLKAGVKLNSTSWGPCLLLG